MAQRVAYRARIIHLSAAGKTPPEIATALGINVKMARYWIKQFNAGGLANLADAARSGRPRRYGRFSPQLAEEIDEVAYMPPPQLDLPFAHWSPSRLARYLDEARGIEVTGEELRRMYKFQDYTDE
jgi:transposase